MVDLNSYVPTLPGKYFLSNYTAEQISAMYKSKTTFWATDQSVPFTAFDQPSYREMFKPFHIDAMKIVAGSNTIKICEEVYEPGKLTQDVTLTDMETCKGSWTTYHWTGQWRDVHHNSIPLY